MRARTFILVAAAVASNGCISYVSVERATKDSPGIRYALPDPYLLVTPQADGTTTYEWLYLPNLANEYAVVSKSIIAKYTMDLKLENGLLTEVTSKLVADAVASKAAETLGTIGAARKEAAAASAKAASEKTAANEKAVTDAELAVAQATAVIEELKKPTAAAVAKGEDKLAAALELAKARAALSAAKKQRDQSASMDAGAPSKERRLPKVWGPVLFRVVQKDGDVELRAVNIQRPFETVAAVVTTKGTSPSPTFKVAKISADEKETLLEIDMGPARIASSPLPNLNLGNEIYDKSKMQVSQGANDNLAIIKFTPKLPKGAYTVQIYYQIGGSTNAPGSKSLTFSVQ